MTAPALPTGTQHEIRHGEQRAVVTEVGAAIREYSWNGVPVLDGFAEDAMSTPARGCPLIPWPNRIAGGRYTWDGRDHQAPINEPDKGNALHGFTRFLSWDATQQTQDSVTMALRLHPREGYPFVLDLAVRYALDERGLTVTASTRNAGSSDAPYGFGHHPYLTVGTRQVDAAELQLRAATYLPVGDDGTPTGRMPVDGTEFDFRTGRRIGDIQIDHAFTDLHRDGEGRAWLTLAAPDQDREVRLWVDDTFRYLEVFTGDTVPDEHRRRQGLGVEPMTCPPNAFATGEDVRRLHPGDDFTCRWGIVTAAKQHT